MKMHELNWPDGVEPVIDQDADALATRLAEKVSQWLAEALSQRGQASLAVSGGSTPMAFFRALGGAKLDWSRVFVTLADERWVPPDHDDSNERLVRENLLQGAAASARFIGLKQPQDSAVEGQTACEAALAALPWPLDVLILGMGNDGHTASLFPDAPELAKALGEGNVHQCIAVHPASTPQARMSLTGRALLEARHTVLHLKGEQKLETLERALADVDAVLEMPIRAFLRAGLKVYWSP